MYQTESVFKGCFCWLVLGPWPQALENAFLVHLNKGQVVSYRISCYTSLLSTGLSVGSAGHSGMGSSQSLCTAECCESSSSKRKDKKKHLLGNRCDMSMFAQVN